MTNQMADVRPRGRPLRAVLALSLVAAILTAVAPARAHHGPPYPSGPDHSHGEMVDYPLFFPVADDPYFWDSFYSSRCCDPGEIHHAQDLMAPKMTPVYAAATGTVRYVNWSWHPDNIDPDRCCTMAIRHDDGWETWYIHLNNDTPGTDDGQGWGVVEGIVPGSRVTAGQHIGWVGDSGNAENTSPHLHFELIDPHGVRVNPYQALQAAEANGGMPLCNGVAATILGDADGDGLIEGTAGDDVIIGTMSGESILGYAGNDVICGLGGDDVIVGGGGNDTIFGGDGDDDLAGSVGDDILDAGDGNDVVHGHPGADTISGGHGSDRLFGDRGVDTLYAGTSDVIASSLPGDRDIMFGGPDNDTMVGGRGNDVLIGGAGDDDMSGEPGADELRGGPGDDTLDGGTGGDAIWADEDSDTAFGGRGRDVIVTGIGVDVIDGGTGSDAVDFRLSPVAITVDLSDGTGTSVTLIAVERIFGTPHDDTLRGSDARDVMNGRSGNDLITLGGGPDQSNAGPGDDWIDGGAGNDRLIGGPGSDTGDGGPGTDVCLVETPTTCEN